MTNPTVFQNRPAAESPEQEDAGVLQETSGNVDSGNVDIQKTSNHVSTDKDRFKAFSDPFDANSSFFSSGDPFGVPLEETTKIHAFDAFSDDFFTPLQSEASQSKPESVSEDRFFQSVDDPPLEVIGMASSDEEGEGDETPTTNVKKEPTISSSNSKPPSDKSLMISKSKEVKAKVSTEEIDDPPLELVDMDSSEDEAPKSITLAMPKKPIPIQESKESKDSIPVSVGSRPTMSGTRASVSSPRSISMYGTTPSNDGSRQHASSYVAPLSQPDPIISHAKERKVQQLKTQQDVKVQQKKARGPASVSSAPNRTETDAYLDDNQSAYGSITSSPSSRRVHPAAEAAGKSSSQRARILAKQRRNRPEPTVVTTPERRHANEKDQRDDYDRSDRSFSCGIPQGPNTSKTSRIYGKVSTSRMPAQREKSVVQSSHIPAQKEKSVVHSPQMSRGANALAPREIESEASEIRNLDQKAKVPVKPPSMKVYAVERPHSILKKPRRALPADPSQYTVRQPLFVN